MRIIGIIILGVIIFAAFGSLMDDDTSGGSATSTSSASSEPAFNVDTSQAAYNERDEAIRGLKESGVIHEVYQRGMVAGPEWFGLSHRDKETVAGAVFSQFYSRDKSFDYLPIRHWQTDKHIGSFGEAGLKID